jgi:ubiquinone/menaquinone biosynthesis C-methylase UbiE
MAELYRLNPTDRFSGLAGVYAQSRPDYPAAAIDYLMTHCRLGPGSLLVDVGSGTGIASRLFARRQVSVIGIEPNEEMRSIAQAEILPADFPAPRYRAGTAEATGLDSGIADLVLAAQAFHWFEPQAALAEFYRLLKQGGWAALLWNERDESDPFTAAYGHAFRAVPGAAALETERGQSGRHLLGSFLFQETHRMAFSHQQPMDEKAMLGRAFSASYAPREPVQAEALATALRAAFARFHHNGQVVLRYETSVYLGRRPFS